MKVFTNIAFTGHYPVGTAAVVIADTEEEAARYLNNILQEQGLPGDAQECDMAELPMDRPSVRVLCDGNY